MDRKEAERFFDENVRIHEKEFINFILNTGYVKSEAEDILQEAYARMWKHVLNETFGDNPKRFTYRIIRNCMSETWRKSKKFANVVSNIISTTDGEMDIYEKLASNDNVIKDIIENFDAELAYETIFKLKDDYRKLIHMRYIAEMDTDEMLEMTGMKPKTLSSKMCRALKKYRQLYFEEYTKENIDGR